MKQIILVGGLPGTGKSTLCNRLVEEVPNCSFLDADKFYLEQGSKPANFDELSEEQRKVLRENYLAKKMQRMKELLEKYDLLISD